MADIYDQIGSKIRELRTTLRGKGISQEELARAVKTTANTVSRWETATYKPSIADLEVLARFFGVPMAVFFPEAQPASRTNALHQRNCRPGRSGPRRSDSVCAIQKGAASETKGLMFCDATCADTARRSPVSLILTILCHVL